MTFSIFCGVFSDTFRMGALSGFNAQLNNTQRRYTFFVPRDKGWQKTELDYPSAHKKLFMRDYSYHVSTLFYNVIYLYISTFYKNLFFNSKIVQIS